MKNSVFFFMDFSLLKGRKYRSQPPAMKNQSSRRAFRPNNLLRQYSKKRSARKEQFLKAREVYERLHEDLLFTEERQDYDAAVNAFEVIDARLRQLCE